MIDISMRFWGINPANSVFIPQSLALRSIVLGGILVYFSVVERGS